MQSSWSLEQLKTFVEVVRSGSFTKAAETLSLSQPAVSVQIRSLETSLGVQLLERRPRKLLLTDPGQILYQYAERIARIEDEFRAEVADIRGLGSGTLRLGAGATPSIFTLAGLFAEYYSRWPSIELRVQIGRTRELVQNVLDDKLDLAIISSETQTAGLEKVPIYEERCVAIAGPSHPLTKHHGNVDVAEVASHPLVMLPAESGFRRFLEEALASRGIHLNTAMELASLEAIKEVVRTGVLAAIVPQTAAPEGPGLAGLRVLGLTGAELTRKTVAIRRSDKYVSESMKAFYRLLAERWPRGGLMSIDTR